MSRAVLWFRNDLRVHDNELLSIAENYDEVVPLYCFDPRHFEETSFGFPKTGGYRTHFLVETLKALRENLRQMDADLIVRTGKPEDIIRKLADHYSMDKIYAQEEVTSEEREVEKKVREASGSKLELIWGSTLFHREDLPFSFEEIPDVFTQFRKKCEKKSAVRDEIATPDTLRMPADIEPGEIPTAVELCGESADIDSRSVLPFKGGEGEALQRLKTYFWKQDLLHKYKYTRNGLLGADYSSKFSPWLANGSLSPRRIYYEVKKYEEERKSNTSTYWMIFELIWRDYFRFSAAKYGDKIFRKGGIQGKEREWKGSEEDFEKWATGNTGIPFIDANMRELTETGYMSNRGRQNVASFLAQNLDIDWRKGAEFFESFLLDYDVCSNYGNWAYNSTVGHDPRNRYFNILNQAGKYDKKGEYVRHWLPELNKVPEEFIHEPHKMNPEQQTLFEVEIGKDYPEPMINLEASYEEIKRRD